MSDNLQDKQKPIDSNQIDIKKDKADKIKAGIFFAIVSSLGILSGFGLSLTCQAHCVRKVYTCRTGCRFVLLLTYRLRLRFELDTLRLKVWLKFLI